MLAAADLHQHVVDVDRLGIGFPRRSGESGLGIVAVLERASLLHVFVGRMLLANVRKRLVDLLVGHRNLDLFRMNLLVSADVDFRQDLKAGLEAHRLASSQIEVRHLWLRNRNQVLFFRFLSEVTRNQVLDKFALDIFAKALADDGSRNLAPPEARNPGMLLKFADNGLFFFCHHIGGDLDGNLSLTGVRSFGLAFFYWSQGSAFRSV